MSAVTITPRESYAYLVWRKAKGRPPRFRHETRAEAEAEAARLASVHQGATFLVLQELARFRCDDAGPNSAGEPAGEPDGAISPPTRASPGSKGGRA